MADLLPSLLTKLSRIEKWAARTEGMAARDEFDTIFIAFVAFVCILPVIAVFGIVGNVLTIIILRRKEMHSSAIPFLRVLAVADTMLLLVLVFYSTPIAYINYKYGIGTTYFEIHYLPFIYIVVNNIYQIVHLIDVLAIVLISLERYISICYPFLAYRLVTRTSTYGSIIGVCIASTIYCIPYWIGYTIKWYPCAPQESSSQINSTSAAVNNGNLTSMGGGDGGATCPWPALSDFGMTEGFTFYRKSLYAIVYIVGPLVVLVILNFNLIRELRKMRTRQTNMSSTTSGKTNDETVNFTVSVVVIIIAFLILKTPSAIFAYDVFEIGSFNDYILGTVTYLSIALNSSINFLIYTAFGSRFRKTLRRYTHNWSIRSESKRTQDASSSQRVVGESSININEKHQTSSRGIIHKSQSVATKGAVAPNSGGGPGIFKRQSTRFSIFTQTTWV